MASAFSPTMDIYSAAADMDRGTKSLLNHSPSLGNITNPRNYSTNFDS